MLESTEYTLNDLTIIIHSNVNEFIDFNLIDANFDKIIFSNYNDIKIFIETNNEYYYEHKNHWKSQFNQQIILTNNLTHLTLGFCFNRKPSACDIFNITFCNAKPKNNFIIFILFRLE